MYKSITEQIKLSATNITRLLELVPQISNAAELLAGCITKSCKVLTCGNGGSAADACHMVGELVGKLGRNRPGMPALTLNADLAVSTSLANDYGYDMGIVRQVEALGAPGDILVAISTSGNSPNIVNAARAARDGKIHVVALTGPNVSELAQFANITLLAPGENTQRIQEAHGTIIHILCSLVEDLVYPK